VFEDLDNDDLWDMMSEPVKHATEGATLPSGNWIEYDAVLDRRVSHSNWRDGLVLYSAHADC
jgi:hypothetical protein